MILHNEARNLLVEAYEKTHDAKGIAMAYGVLPKKEGTIHGGFNLLSVTTDIV